MLVLLLLSALFQLEMIIVVHSMATNCVGWKRGRACRMYKTLVTHTILNMSIPTKPYVTTSWQWKACNHMLNRALPSCGWVPKIILLLGGSSIVLKSLIVCVKICLCVIQQQLCWTKVWHHLWSYWHLSSNYKVHWDDCKWFTLHLSIGQLKLKTNQLICNNSFKEY